MWNKAEIAALMRKAAATLSNDTLSADQKQTLQEDLEHAASDVGLLFSEAERLEHVEAAGNVSYDQGRLDGGSDHVVKTDFVSLLTERLTACQSKHAMLRNGFEQNGGRGIEVADEIDAVKREIDQIEAVLTLVQVSE